MNNQIDKLMVKAGAYFGGDGVVYDNFDPKKFAELMIAEFSDVVKQTANELTEFYTRQGATEEEVLMRVNGALVVLGHIRERFKD